MSSDRKSDISLSFHGAVGNDVTGSTNMLEIRVGNAVRKILIDCGMYQGDDGMSEEADMAQINPREISAIILTHAHLDHCGEIPLLYKMGYEGEVFATDETLRQATAIMYDCANINKKHIPKDLLDALETIQNTAKKSKDSKEKQMILDEISEIEAEALYLQADVDEAVKHFHPIAPMKLFKLFDGVTAKLIPNTHQNGSTSIEIYLEYAGEKTGVAFSGDIGPEHSYLYREMYYEPNDAIDYCIVESLHGTSNPEETLEESIHGLRKLIRRCIRDKKKLYIGVFALDRSALLLALMNKFMREGIWMDVWFDSPLGEIQLKNYINSYTSKNSEWFRSFERDPFTTTNIKFASYYNSHMELVRSESPKVVLVTSCMGQGGRILDYFNEHIQDENAVFAFVGFLPKNCNSNILCEAERGKIMELMGKHYVKKCETVKFHGFTSHGYYKELLAFVNRYPNVRGIFLNHAEEIAKADVKWQLQHDVSAEIMIPEYGETYNL